MVASHHASGRMMRAVMVLGLASMLVALAGMSLLVSPTSQTRSELEQRFSPQQQRQQQLWLGEHWYIKGLEDDGKFMVPESVDPETSGNSLFDFGKAAGTPTDPETKLPAGGKTPNFIEGDGEKPGHFDIEAIRLDEDGYVPYYERAEYYDDTYPKYTEKYGITLMPEVAIEDGHVVDIQENVPRFGDGNFE